MDNNFMLLPFEKHLKGWKNSGKQSHGISIRMRRQAESADSSLGYRDHCASSVAHFIVRVLSRPERAQT